MKPKFLITMLSFLFIFCCISLHAQSEKKQTLSLHLQHVSVKEFLNDIEAKTTYRFVYDGMQLKGLPSISVDFDNTDAIKILNTEFSKIGLTFRIKGTQIIVNKQEAATTVSKISKVYGVVVDEKNAPLMGATVLIKGSSSGTITDADGKYKLTVPRGSQHPVLVCTFLGYSAKEVAVRDKERVDIAMNNQNYSLSDVVVIGYGAVKKSDATGAVDVLKSGDFNKGLSTSPEQLLNGHIAGVQISQSSGQPGANTNVRIRGVNSISASSEPLYVIDGVPIENNRSTSSLAAGAADNGLSNTTLNPLSMIAASDIESITVLKDASATAIYGSRGANGVIIITTKSGKNGKMAINVSNSVGFASVSKKLDVLNADQYRQYVPNAVGTASTDWQDEIFRTAVVHDHNVSVSSGNKNTSYRASLSASNQQGIVLNTGLDRYTLRFNLNHKMFDQRLIINVNANNTNYNFQNVLEQQTGGADGGIINNALKADPTQPVYNPDGTFNEYAETVRNPVAMAKQVSDKTTGDRFIGNADASFFFIPKELSLKVNFGYDVDNATRKVYQPLVSKEARDVKGRALLEKNTYANYLFESYLTYNKTFSKKHSLNFVGGYSWQEFANDMSNVLAEGFVNDNLGPNNIAGGSYQLAQNNRERNRLISVYGRVNYDFDNKYLITATLRYDGSSRFGQNNRWATFPSAAFAWKIKQEPFLVNVSAINDLKVRLGYGITGNQDIGNFQYSSAYNISPKGTMFNGKFYPAYDISGIANPNLKWEQTSQANFGIDYAFLNNKISGSIDLYSKKTTNLLLAVDAVQPAVSGTYLDNVGAMTNKGVEFSINANLCSAHDFEWNANFNFSYNKNKITELYNNKDIIYGVVSGAGASGNTQILRVGQPFGTFYGQKFLRTENGKEIFESPDREIIGHALPDVVLGFSNSFKYRNWDLAFTLRSDLGGQNFNNTRAEISQGSRLPGQNSSREGAEFYKDGGRGIVYTSSRWIENASFLRMDNITLGYNFHVAPKVIKSMRLYVTAQNLFVLTGYSGYDPEVNNNSGSNNIKSVGIDYCSYPHARTFLMGLDINF